MSKAKSPPMPAPAFDPPRTIEGRRTAGHVQVPDPTAEDAGPLEMSWKVASEGALEEEPNPTKLRRTASIAGNVLVAKTAQDNNNSSSSSRRAYWLQRTITEEAHNQKFVRIGFPLQPFTIEGENNKSTSWTVVKTDKGSLYPFHMVAIKVQKRSSVFPDEDGGHPGSGEDDKNSRSEDEKATIEQAANHAKAEISALQLLQAADPDGKKNVLRALDVIDDQVNIYIILPYCKEGTLLDRLGETPDGRLEESVAKKYFSNILNGLETLQKVQLCHRKLCPENVLLRGGECLISSLGWSLKVPTSDDGTFHLLEPQSACGKKPEYLAPEMFRNEAFDGYAVDLWAAGVILYLMLFGDAMMFAAPIPEDPRFQEICVAGHLKAVVEKFYALNPDPDPVSDEAIDLLQNMLQADPANRLTLMQVKNHAWLKTLQMKL